MKNKMSARQRIDASHEARLWITQVILPVAGGVLLIDYLYPNLKYQIRDDVQSTAEKIKNKFKKES